MKKIVCFVFLVLAARINAQVCYSNATYFNAASGPWTIINKDFNNDGKPDIATANQFGNCIAVLLGDGTGNFGVPSTYVTGFHPVSAFSADFNNDNNADIVTANYGTGTISVFLGAGNGTFGTATTFTAGTQSSSVTGADFNTDGKIDLAVANYGANNFSVFMGDGTGNFNLTANYAVSTNPTSITSSDFNGDNFIDIASCNYSTNSVSVLLGNGAGSFGSRQDFIVGSHPQFIVSADLTNDGKPDLATANISAGTVSLLKNLGSGSFGSIVNVFVNDNPYSLTASDLNGDGNIDLGVGHNSANYVSVLLGDGNGSVSSVTIDSSFQNPQFVTSADFNGDGKPEIASGNYNSNNVAVFINCTPPPTCTVSVTVNTPPAICINASAMLSASGATTYNWFPSTGLSTTTGSTVVASPTVTTTYTITGHSVGCLPSSSVITVTVLPTAVPTVTVNSPSVCAGGTVTLTANGASSYSWSPSIGLSAVGGSTVSASPTSTTIYTITGANGTCTSTANSTVTIKPVAVVSVNSSTICAGNSAVLTASGASTYTWSTGSTASTITVSPSSSSVYTLIASNGTCTAVDSASVHVNNFPLPTVTCHATQTFVCGGSPVTLYAAGANTYSWSTWNFTNWVGDSITFTPSIGATYNVTGVDVNGCKGSSSISISVSNINVITSASSYTFCPGTPFNDTLRASGATSYTWSANAGSAITTSVVVSPSVTTTYTVTGQNASGCTSVKSITVNSQAPVITQVSDLFVCSGLMVPAINFTTTVLGSSVTWHNSNTAIGLSATGGGNIASYGSPNTFVQKAGTLSVTASKNGCVGPPMYFNITINPKPLITVSATSNTICAGNADTLTAAGASTYTWSANAGNAVSPVVYVSPVSSTVYTINATDLNGCSNYGFTKSVTVNALPAISANATATIVCNGTNVTLTGGGGNTYTWSPAATLSSVNGTTVTATPTASTVYTVTGTGGTCTATATSTVIVNPTPTISVNSDTICLGQYASLIAGGGNT
ncbi:MAG: beta strand repeat-containing protein, partial [Bacteroidia bacterium]